MSKLSDEQVVERLARRIGEEVVALLGQISTKDKDGNYTCHFNPPEYHPLLTSRDALSHVLAGLSPAEWDYLNAKLCDMFNSEIHGNCLTQFVVTIQPRDLAYAIASALGEPEVGKEGER